MCRLHTEGILYTGCGHYIITRKPLQEDCKDRFCMNSQCHQKNCPHCPNCIRYLYPDASETIIERNTGVCRECNYWWLGHGARHRS